jgi:hypothetical protein
MLNEGIKYVCSFQHMTKWTVKETDCPIIESRNTDTEYMNVTENLHNRWYQNDTLYVF